jgi:hypothetical protein
MTDNTLSWGGIAIRFLLAILLVYATWNPWGLSFTDWALVPLFAGGQGEAGRHVPLKFLAGVLLLTGWVLYLQATHRSLGAAGATLVAAICGGVVWLLASWRVFAMQGPAIAHAILVVLAIILAMGMSWSHVSRRMSGQVDTDAVE